MTHDPDLRGAGPMLDRALEPDPLADERLERDLLGLAPVDATLTERLADVLVDAWHPTTFGTAANLPAALERAGLVIRPLEEVARP